MVEIGDDFFLWFFFFLFFVCEVVFKRVFNSFWLFYGFIIKLDVFFFIFCMVRLILV